MYPNQTSSKIIEYVYSIFEEPHLEPGIHKQDMEKLDLDFKILNLIHNKILINKVLKNK